MISARVPADRRTARRRAAAADARLHRDRHAGRARRDRREARAWAPTRRRLLRGFARPNLDPPRAWRSRGRASARATWTPSCVESLGRPGQARGVAIVYSMTRVGAEQEATAWPREDGGPSRITPGSIATCAPRAQADVQRRPRGHRRGHGRVRDGDRPPGRPRRDSPVAAGVHRGLLPGGRAARAATAQPAWGLLLVSPGDMALRRRLLESAEGTTAETLEHKWNLFLELLRWAEGGSCRHDAILRYFGDEAETLAGCGICDVCETLGEARSGQDPEEVALIVRKALSGVARVHGRFGMTAAVQLVRGVADERLLRAGLDQTTTFGVLREHTEEWLLRLLRRLVTAGWIEFSTGDRPRGSSDRVGPGGDEGGASTPGCFSRLAAGWRRLLPRRAGAARPAPRSNRTEARHPPARRSLHHRHRRGRAIRRAAPPPAGTVARAWRPALRRRQRPHAPGTRHVQAPDAS